MTLISAKLQTFLA